MTNPSSPPQFTAIADALEAGKAERDTLRFSECAVPGKKGLRMGCGHVHQPAIGEAVLRDMELQARNRHRPPHQGSKLMPDSPRQDTGASANADQALAVPVEPVARLDPSGFDPSRFDPSRRESLTYEIHHLAHKAVALSRQIATMTYGGMISGRPRSRMLRAVDRDATAIHGLAEAMIAIATEAQRAETENTGSVHEGAGPKGHRHD